MIKIALLGDVVLARGVDYSLPPPRAPPKIYESYIKDAKEYALLSGVDPHNPIEEPFGDLVKVIRQNKPDLCILNLECALTAREPGSPWPGKGIHYRGHPSRAQYLHLSDGLSSKTQTVCSLANNHILDWGYEGLWDTLISLSKEGIPSVGAGFDLKHAQTPFISSISFPKKGEEGKEKKQVQVFGAADVSSGVPVEWAASPSQSGIWLLRSDLQTPQETASHVLRDMGTAAHDVVIFTLHYGPNWGYEIDDWVASFARLLIDGGVDIVHMHSSHHVNPIEIYRGKLIIYGSGDAINDYEGIEGHEEFSPNDRLLLTASLNHDSDLVGLQANWFVPHHVQLEHRSSTDLI